MVKLKFNSTAVNKMFKNAVTAEQKAVRSTYDFFVKQTPIKSGTARNSTSLRQNTIEADYEYAAVLDKGRHMTSRGARGSYQAPEGMTKPSIRYFRAYLNDLIRKIR